MSRTMRALFLCGFHPTSDAVSSGPKIVAREIDALIAKGWEVTTVSFENELDRRHHKEGFAAPRGDRSRIFRLTPSLRLLAALRFPTLPFAASPRPLIASRYVKKLLAETTFDRIDVEFIQAAEVLPRSEWHRATVVCHDVLTQLYERRYHHARPSRKLFALAEMHRIRRWETEVLRGFGRVTVLNEKDQKLVTALTGRSDVAVRYPQVPRYIDPQERTSRSIDPSTMLFWGHLGRRENVDAVHYFVTKILPDILAQRPDARLIVAGIDPPKSIQELAGRSVTVTGYVEDPSSLFRSAAVGIVPVRLGAGIKIKTLEMIACGLPVVATSVGAEGVAEADLLTTVDNDAEFAAAVVHRLNASVLAGQT